MRKNTPKKPPAHGEFATARTPGIDSIAQAALQWSAPSPPRRTYSSLASISAETTFYWAYHFRVSLTRKFHFLEIENPIAETQAEDEMLPIGLAEFLRQDGGASRRALERGMKPRINRAVPMGLIRGKSEGLVLPRPFDVDAQS